MTDHAGIAACDLFPRILGVHAAGSHNRTAGLLQATHGATMIADGCFQNATKPRPVDACAAIRFSAAHHASQLTIVIDGVPPSDSGYGSSLSDL